MEALRQLYSDLDFLNVRSYIQSGNVIFESKKEKSLLLEKKIADKISKVFGFEVPVMVKEYGEFKEIINANPFLKDKSKDSTYFHVTFLSEKPEPGNFNKLKEGEYGNDAFKLVDKAMYLYTPNGYGNTKLSNNFLENKLKVVATTRNWKTVNELLKIAESKF